MIELKKPSAEKIVLLREWQRQYESGEHDAGYWRWEHNIKGTDYWEQTAFFYFNGVFRCIPSRTHPHYAVYKEWEAHKASGAVDRGEVKLVRASLSGGSNAWAIDVDYEICKTDRHPDNQKPKLKLIDWRKVPIGTMTNLGEVLALRLIRGVYQFLIKDVDKRDYCMFFSIENLRIVPATKWTAIQDEDFAPVYEGFVIEYRYVNGSGLLAACNHPLPNCAIVVAYRVIGIADGYTDDQAKATI